MDPRKQLGLNLRALRKARGLSQERFALEHDIDRTYVSGIERGQRNPTVTVLQRLADALGMALSEQMHRSLIVLV
jgi:transcriptional regulator with XRE-family HTH domain